MFPTHTKIADNVNEKEDAFNARLQDLDSILGSAVTVNIGSDPDYELASNIYYKNAVFVVTGTIASGDFSPSDFEDEEFNTGDSAHLIVPSTRRPTFAVYNDTNVPLYVQVQGQTQNRYIRATEVGYFFYNEDGHIQTPHGVDNTVFPLLSDVVASTVFDIDVTSTDCYSGTGITLSNLTVLPADSAAQNDYDFEFGDGATSTTYPTFNGTAGDPNAYLSFDGGDYLKVASGANTAFVEAIHKDSGSDGWIAFTGRTVIGGGQVLLSTRSAGSTAGIAAAHWSDESFSFEQDSGTTVRRTSVETSFQTGFDFCVVMSWDRGTNNLRLWVNGVEQGGSFTFDTGTSAASGVLTIGRYTGGTLPLASGFRIYGFAMGNEYLDGTAEALVRQTYEARHNRSYTRDQTTLADNVTGLGVVAEWNASKYASAWGASLDMQNIIAAPADGSATSAYHLPNVGTPTFSNTGGSAPASWNPSGTSYWQIGANTTFLKNLHKTTGGTDWCFIAVIDSSGALSADRPLMATNAGPGAGNDGLRIETNTSEELVLAQDGTAGSATDYTWAQSNLRDQVHFIAIAWDTSAGEWKLWYNSSQSIVVPQTFAASVLDATGLFTLHAESDGANAVGSGVLWHMAFLLNTVPTDAKMLEIMDYVEGAGSQNKLLGSGIKYFDDAAGYVYVSGDLFNAVGVYTLTEPYDLSTMQYFGRYHTVTEDSVPQGAWIRPSDGLKMYVTGDVDNDILEYDLEIPFDPSSATYVQNYVVAQDTGLRGVEFNTSGTKMFIAGSQFEDIYEYALGTAWDISTASYTTNYTGHPGSNIENFRFADNGKKLYTVDVVTDLVYQHTLSTGYDLSTASYDSKTLSFASTDTNTHTIEVHSSGTKIWLLGNSTLDIYEYTLGTPFDISTAGAGSVVFTNTFESDGLQIVTAP